MTKFVKCQLGGSGRAYTYDANGHELAIGDQVRVPTPHGKSLVAEVVGLTDDEPPFETKPILGKVEEEEDEPLPPAA